ncbi:D-alanyl-D-alanine carboxypeptidase family protein [Sideroxyarcus emersonii]|uniref:D-alanyl-D-alanine carboxypeptidase family protein n=1 Tax=Sideroxyarcus emersonii TaxID=2764705 RepID=UPI001F15AEFD|nr:D-alanyl-D-alanine carboxypeptidase family protein [Sideroxyarcus emersonii]
MFLFALIPTQVFPQEPVSSPPILAASSYALYDYTSGQFLLEQNGNARIPPAHLTKLMTAYVAFGAIKQGKLSLAQRLIPSAYATRTLADEPRMFLNAGKAVTVDDLLHGLIVQSANDAARVLAETLANHEMALADIMNAEAQRLGLKDTHFVNATGAPEAQHYSSAHDLALLAAAIVRDFPELYRLYAQREFQYGGINQFNRNRLLWLDPFVDGLAASNNEAEEFDQVASARRDDHRLISVVIGAATDKLRSSESQRLLNYGFQDFETIRLYSRDQAVSAKHIWKGTSNQLDIGFSADRYLTIPKGQRNALKATLETRQPLLAPIDRGQQIGTLHLSLDGKPYLDLPVVALDDIPLANVFSRGIDNIRLLFQ